MIRLLKLSKTEHLTMAGAIVYIACGTRTQPNGAGIQR